MRISYFLLFGFAFLLGMTCAFTGFRQYPIPPQDIDFKIMERYRNRNGVGFCGVTDVPKQLSDKEGFAAGERLFKAQCAQCHNRNMVDDLTGPALNSIEKRWAAYPREDLYNWIRNSQQMIADGHPRAVELWEKWQPTVMNNFSLTDEEIENLLVYIEVH